ncbi:MAG: hypothetical protein KAX05_07715 [Bacteroidales bacterium]|nr:hypothetical protein [Bacteroidales bacterium]
MKNKKSSLNSKKKEKDNPLREKKIKNPRKGKNEKYDYIYDELEEIDPQELLEDMDDFE